MEQQIRLKTFSHGSITQLLGMMLLLVALQFAGCRDSAPDDVIVEEETTEALVFVKTRCEDNYL